MSNKLPTCCEFHGFEEGGCKCGKLCPAGRVDLQDFLRRMHRQAEAAIRGDPIGVEAALPISYVGPEPKEPRPLLWPVIGWFSLFLACAAFAVLVYRG